jgi:hypothetical protein
MTYKLTAPGTPQAQRYAFTVLYDAKYHLAAQLGNRQPMDDTDEELVTAIDVIEACQLLVKWGTVEIESYD